MTNLDASTFEPNAISPNANKRDSMYGGYNYGNGIGQMESPPKSQSQYDMEIFNRGSLKSPSNSPDGLK